MFASTQSSTYDCDECDRTYSSPHSLARHVRLHVRPIGSQCHKCGRTFVSERALKHHLDSHSRTRVVRSSTCSHDVSPQDVVVRPACEICGLTLADESESRKHLRTHKVYKCGVCEASFADVEPLRSHVEQKHIVRAHVLRSHTKKRTDNRLNDDQGLVSAGKSYYYFSEFYLVLSWLEV